MDAGYLPLIAVAAVLTYLTRISGFALRDRALPPFAIRFLAYVPIAAFAALAAPGIAVRDDDLAPRLAAAVAAGLAVVWLRRLWACLAAGLAVFWATRLVL